MLQVGEKYEIKMLTFDGGEMTEMTLWGTVDEINWPLVRIGDEVINMTSHFFVSAAHRPIP